LLSNLNNKLCLAFVLIIIIIISNCGFEPLYSERSNSSTQKYLDNLFIEPIPGRLGQTVRNQLLISLQTNTYIKSPLYSLFINLDTERKPVAFKLDKTITRYNLEMISEFSLVNNVNGEILFNETNRSIAAYSIVLSEFANITAAQDAERRAAIDISQQIVTRLGIYFSNN